MPVMNELTVVIPAKNERNGLPNILPKVVASVAEVIVVDDGSSDGTGEYAASVGATVITHKKSKGNGGAVKAGLSAAKTKYVALMDGDGQHDLEGLEKVYSKLIETNSDLVVGARNADGQASLGRGLANRFYNRFASWMVGENVQDLTSGQRVFVTEKVRQIIWLLPNTFSYPTTSTMLFYRLGYDVQFESITVHSRVGESHINILRDGFRFFLIIMKVGTLFSPFKLFVPISMVLFALGSLRYIYTFLAFGAFTNMSALLFVSSLIVFLMGILSEQMNLSVIGVIENKKER